MNLHPKPSQNKLWIGFMDILLSLIALYALVQLFYAPAWHERYFIIGILGGLIFVSLSHFQGLYKNISAQNSYFLVIKFTQNWLIIGALIITVAFVSKDIQNLARHFLLAWVLLMPLILLFSRFIVIWATPKTITNILVVGSDYKFTKHELRRLKHLHIELFDCPGDTHKEIEKSIENQCIHQILLNTELKDAELVTYLTKLNLAGISYLSIRQFMESVLRKIYIPYCDGGLNHLDDIQNYSKSSLLVKKMVDIFGTIGIGFFSLPLILISIYKIKKESSGVLIYKQVRIGKNNREFILHKFRSMYENQIHNPYTQENDNRIFPFGRTMRKYRMDEIPQLINVLKNDLHLIGPRPEWNILIDGYEKEIPYYSKRHVVKPGLTGWAQVNYPYGSNVEDARQKLMYDLYYIKNWSLALELETLCKTAKVVLAKKGL